VPTPAGRVLALAVTAGLGPIQYALDPAPYPACGLSFRDPDRLDDFHNEHGIDLLHGERADNRIDIGR